MWKTLDTKEGEIMKKYTTEVSEEEMHCIVVVAKLLIRLLIEFYASKSILAKVNPLRKALKALSRKDK